MGDIGPKREEVTESWRKLHNDELYDPYSSDGSVLVCCAHPKCGY